MSGRVIQLSLLLVGLSLLAKGLYMPAKAQLAKHLIHKAWYESLETHQAVLPWSWMDAYPVAKLTFGKSDSHIVLNTDSGQALAFGPGLVTGTSLFDGSMIAIAAHKNTEFSTLKDLRHEDVISLHIKNGDMRYYSVSHSEIIDLRRQKLVRGDEESLALITCYPFDAVSFNGPLRYVVYAEKVKAPALADAS